MNSGSLPSAQPSRRAVALRFAKAAAIVLWFFLGLGYLTLSEPVTDPTGWQIVMAIAVLASWCAAAYWILDVLCGQAQPGQDAPGRPPHAGATPSPSCRRVVGPIAMWMFIAVVIPAVFVWQMMPDPHAAGWWGIGILVVPLCWVLAGYWIYDSLFTMAERRWAGATKLRKIVDPLLRSLLFGHHDTT